MLSSHAYFIPKCLNFGTLDWFIAWSWYLSFSRKEPHLNSSWNTKAVVYDGGHPLWNTNRSGSYKELGWGKVLHEFRWKNKKNPKKLYDATWYKLCSVEKVFWCNWCLLRHLLRSYVIFPVTVLSSCFLLCCSFQAGEGVTVVVLSKYPAAKSTGHFFFSWKNWISCD